MLLAKGTLIPSAPWHWKKRRCKRGWQQYKGMTMHASWLLLLLNVDLQFETWEGLTHWVLKKKEKTKTQKTPPLQQWHENCWVETGQPQSWALQGKGPSCGGKFCHRAPKMHLVDFHLLAETQKIHKYHCKIPENTPTRKACSYLIQFLKMLHLSSLRKYEASGTQTGLVLSFHFRKNYPILIKVRKKKIIPENPALPPSPMPFKKLVSKYSRCWDVCWSPLLPKAGVWGLCSSPRVTPVSVTMPRTHKMVQKPHPGANPQNIFFSRILVKKY